MKMKSGAILVVSLVLGAGLLWLLVDYEPAREGWCKLRPKGADSPSASALTTLASQALTPLPAAPNNVMDLPETFKRPSFYRMQAGARTLTVVVNFSGTPRLCVDTDGNGSLAKEQVFPVKSVKEAKQLRHRFGPIRIAPEAGDDQAGATFYAMIYRRDKAGTLWLYPTHTRYGKLRLGKQVYKVALMDGDYDGQFGSVVSLPVDNRWRMPYCDAFAIDYNRDGKFMRSDYGRSEVAPLSRMIAVHGTYYSVHIEPDGSKLNLQPIEPERGQLTFKPSDAKVDLRLWSDAADQYVSFASSGLDLPTGKYQALQTVLRMPDGDGHEWTLAASPNVGRMSLFEIRAGQTTHVKLGPPFVVTSRIEQRSPDLVHITPVLRGCAGEEYRLDFRRNNRRPPDRAFKIVTEDGTVLDKGRFKYG